MGRRWRFGRTSLRRIAEIPRRVRDGRPNHDYVAAKLNRSPWIEVPSPLAKEARALDSIQFNLVNFESDRAARAFQDRVRESGVDLQIFGLSDDNARAFWNWGFIGGPGRPVENPGGADARLRRAPAGPT